MRQMSMNKFSIKDGLMKLVELKMMQISLSFTASRLKLRIRGLGKQLCNFSTVVILKRIMMF